METKEDWRDWMEAHQNDYPNRLSLFRATVERFGVTHAAARSYFYRHLAKPDAPPSRRQRQKEKQVLTMLTPVPADFAARRKAIEESRARLEQAFQQFLVLVDDVVAQAERNARQIELIRTEYETLQEVMDRYSRALANHKQMVAKVDQFGNVLGVHRREA